VRYPGFLKLHADRLAMPIEMGSDPGLFSALSDKYKKYAIDITRPGRIPTRRCITARLGYDAIWKGNRASDAPLLTVYRHFDSASVHKGRWGICRRPSG